MFVKVTQAKLSANNFMMNFYSFLKRVNFKDVSKYIPKEERKLKHFRCSETRYSVEQSECFF